MIEQGLRNQEFLTASPITFKELCIEDLREKRLGLDNEPITVISVKNSQNNSTNYFAFYDHPFVGAHLAHFLNAEAPIKVDPQVAKGAILADYQMPARATHPTDEDLAYGKDVELHQMHEGAAEIKHPYMEFLEQGLVQQDDALKNSKYDNLFNQAIGLRVINHQAIEQAFSDLLAKFKKDKISGETREEVYQSVYRNPIERLYRAFIWEQPEFRPDHYASREIHTGLLIPKFLEQLDKEGQKQLIIARSTVWSDSATINPSTMEIFGKRHEGVDLSFSNGCIELRDQSVNSIQIELQKNSQDLYFPYKTVKYNFTEELMGNALYPVIAWQKTLGGQRKFISQKELIGFLPHLNLDRSKRPDVYLGRNLLGYFSPEITDKWPPEIILEGYSRPPQKMMGAQMAVRDSMDYDKYRHAPELLAGNVIQKLEEHTMPTAA